MSANVYLVFVWGFICVLAVVLELVTASLVSIWFAAGALAAMILAFFGVSPGMQALVFLILSLLVMGLFRSGVRARFFQEREALNAGRVKGKEALVKQRIDNVRGTGIVIVEGIEWTARAVAPGVIEEGSRVLIEEIQGVKLLVRPLSEAELKGGK